MKKIALINCFFGKFPWYFNIFIKSCEYNPSVNFIIFTDNKSIKDKPENVQLIYFTLADFNKLASQILNLDVKITKAYKLCDFKPTYGLLFEKYLTQYDFWGICDIDIVLGRIREFITDEMLNQYDVINARHDFLIGSFLLFRNDYRINSLFTKSKDYKKVFTSSIHYCFDECNFIHTYLASEIDIDNITCEIESMEHVVRKENKNKNIKAFYDFFVIDGLSGKLKWDNGKLSYDNKFEILMYHLVEYKVNEYSKKKTWNHIPKIFYIDKYAFRKKSTKSIISFFGYYFYEEIIPLWFKTIHYTNYYISVLFNIKLKSRLSQGNFKNTYGDISFYVDKDDKEENTLCYYQSSNIKSKLIKSIFLKNVFYTQETPSIKYRYSNSENHKTLRIETTEINGGVFKFE
ncbi:MAG: DUF6625 family protein [Flavobacterium sp.]